jgi:DNA-binding winged helix-turn-helix (wHTH) protein
MNDDPFILNDRFFVNPGLGLVNDQQLRREMHIEPRLMSLLCLLTKHEGTLVKRALITKEIWDDYGNADEALTQAISYLRKVLADEQKIMIETVPKKGYILRVVIRSKNLGENINSSKKPARKKLALLAALFSLLLIVAYFVYRSVSQEGTVSADTVQHDQHAAGAKVRNPDVVPDSLRKNNR